MMMILQEIPRNYPTQGMTQMQDNFDQEGKKTSTDAPRHARSPLCIRSIGRNNGRRISREIHQNQPSKVA
jgi:hypothetical protein